MKCLMFNADCKSIDVNYEYLQDVSEIEQKLGSPLEYMCVFEDVKNIVLIYNRNTFTTDYGFNGKFIVCNKDENNLQDINDEFVPHIIERFIR